MSIEADASPMRRLEALADRFGVFEALATSTIQLSRCARDADLAMDPQVAEAVLEFGDDLRDAARAAARWARDRSLTPAPRLTASTADG